LSVTFMATSAAKRAGVEMRVRRKIALIRVNMDRASPCPNMIGHGRGGVFWGLGRQGLSGFALFRVGREPDANNLWALRALN